MKERKIFLGLSIAALALAGCSQNEFIGDPGSLQGGADRSISFGSYLSRPTSRAAGVDLNEFQTTGKFKVWGYVTTTNKGLSDDITTATGITLHTALSGGKALDGTDLFSRVEEKDESGTGTGNYLWTSGVNKYYWPADGLGKMSFYALSNRATGYASESVTALTAPTNAEGAKFDYTVGTNGTDAATDKQEDLIAAQLYNKVWATSNADSKIVLDFKHLLTQVRFAAKTSDASYRVKILSLKVKGANNVGTFTFDITDGSIGAWSIADATKRTDYTYFDATNTGAQKGTFDTGFPTDNADPNTHFVGTTAVDFPLFGALDNTQALIVLPSVAKAGGADIGLKGVTIEVSYQCYIISGNADEDGTVVGHWVEDGTTLSRKIELTENEMWTMNKKVCYTLTLFNSDNGKIIYTPVVSNWTDQGGSSNLYPDSEPKP